MNTKRSVMIATEIDAIRAHRDQIIEAECELHELLERMGKLYQDLGSGPVIVIRRDPAHKGELESYHAATHSISRTFQKVARVAREMAEGRVTMPWTPRTGLRKLFRRNRTWRH
ncbi:MAG: hypothetical protein OXH70_17455 [Acidobacteria bacterium]|nr:hypothetical protein [Acidobacteriota bacterium]